MKSKQLVSVKSSGSSPVHQRHKQFQKQCRFPSRFPSQDRARRSKQRPPTMAARIAQRFLRDALADIIEPDDDGRIPVANVSLFGGTMTLERLRLRRALVPPSAPFTMRVGHVVRLGRVQRGLWHRDASAVAREQRQLRVGTGNGQPGLQHGDVRADGPGPERQSGNGGNGVNNNGDNERPERRADGSNDGGGGGNHSSNDSHRRSDPHLSH